MLVRIFKHFGLWSPSGWSYRMGDYSFDAPERQKDDGTNFGRIGCTWHVPLAVARILEKYLIKGAGVTIGRIRLKLSGPIGLLSGLNPLE